MKNRSACETSGLYHHRAGSRACINSHVPPVPCTASPCGPLFMKRHNQCSSREKFSDCNQTMKRGDRSCHSVSTISAIGVDLSPRTSSGRNEFVDMVEHDMWQQRGLHLDRFAPHFPLRHLHSVKDIALPGEERRVGEAVGVPPAKRSEAVFDSHLLIGRIRLHLFRAGEMDGIQASVSVEATPFHCRLLIRLKARVREAHHIHRALQVKLAITVGKFGVFHIVIGRRGRILERQNVDDLLEISLFHEQRGPVLKLPSLHHATPASRHARPTQAYRRKCLRPC